MGSLALWYALFLGAWWVVAEGRTDAAGWAVAAAVAAAAVWVRRRLEPDGGHRVRPVGVLRFIPYFLWQSLRGGADVALRAARPTIPLAPALVDHRLRLGDGPGRNLFVAALNLLPGTFAADVTGDRLRVHVLDRRGDVTGRLQELERRVAAVFRAPPGHGSRDGGADAGGRDG